MTDEPEAEEAEEEWDEVLIEMRRFAIEQAVLMRAPGDTLATIFERADRIVDYLANGSG